MIERRDTCGGEAQQETVEGRVVEPAARLRQALLGIRASGPVAVKVREAQSVAE